MSIELKAIAVSRGKNQVLTDVSTTFEPGKFTALIGANGCGKSTLLRAVAGVADYQGSLMVHGRELREIPRKNRVQNLAFVAQHTDVDTELSVEQIVMLGRMAGRGLWASATTNDAEVVATVMEQTDIAHLAHRRWTQLSGGERQRTQVARALAQDSDCLILDEPTNHLDLHHQFALMDVLQELAHDRHICVVAALHDLSLAARYCDAVTVLADGNKVASGDPREVLTTKLLAETFRVTGQLIDTDTGPVLQCSGACSAGAASKSTV
ncbi:MAG: ABC transporter ATP-binding protein [Corynebacterium sp.]|uniref:ABC transporter ATP-binding protein n=1 Tax=Corynebacterium sp. TaxID=1720 RepID=UPI0026DDC740|nr:ABC transporter ATP-binding protein [Corynebacterium sp.]MDO5097901.1 ABC transporter ATP-binding protein [Corynebacterium sp.]